MTELADRYLVALPRGDGKVFLSWRFLEDDISDLGFDMERRVPGGQWEAVSSTPITDSTNFLDETPYKREYEYRVAALKPDTRELSLPVNVNSGAEATIKALDAPLASPGADTQLMISGELLNDGRMGYVLRSGRAGTVWLSA